MKCVILAAGKGERMRPLTLTTPKPLLKYKGKALIDWVYDSLPEEIDEVIVVVKYLKDQIIEHMSSKNGRRISFVEGSYKGNAYSFLNTKKCFREGERFLVIYGDEVPNPYAVKLCLLEPLSVLLYDNSKFDGVMVLDTNIFGYKPKGGQFRSMVEQFASDYPVEFVFLEGFIGEMNTPQDLI